MDLAKTPQNAASSQGLHYARRRDGVGVGGCQTPRFNIDILFSCYYQPNNYLINSSLHTLITHSNTCSLMLIQSDQINKTEETFILLKKKIKHVLSNISADEYNLVKCVEWVKKCNPSPVLLNPEKVRKGHKGRVCVT